MRNFSYSAIIISLTCCILLLNGCAAFRGRVKDDDVSNLPALDATYGAQDLRKLSQDVADEIAGSNFILSQKDKPIMVIYGIQPRTKTFIDTKAITDSIRTKLINQGKVSFINASRRKELLKEQGYQAQNVTDATRVAIGKQLGAKYMLTGALVEITKQSGRQVRVSKTELVYYQLTIDITDLQTGLIAWATQKEFAREARTPIFGW